MMKKLVLIDGNALVHRAYHALPPLTTKKGELVNAVYGFISIFLKVIKELKPDYLAVTFDLVGPTFRHQEYEKYKATRQKAPQELYDQLARVKEFVGVFGVPIYEKEGFEADDVIGTIVSKQTETENVIVTGDLDTLQLVGKNTKVYTSRKGLKDEIIYDSAEIMKRYELQPSQLIDYKSLRGDPSDNIPGAPGVGEKTAISLLKQFGSIDELYQKIEKDPKVINAKLAVKLIEYKDQVLFSRYLVTIRKDVPLDFSLDGCSWHNYNKQKVINLLDELGFASLVKRLADLNGLVENKSSANQLSLI